MPYVTSIERDAKNEGREEGREEGCREGCTNILMRQLSLKRDSLPDDIRGKVQQLPFEQCLSLGDAMLDFESLDDLQAWLRLNPTP